VAAIGENLRKRGLHGLTESQQIVVGALPGEHSPPEDRKPQGRLLPEIGKPMRSPDSGGGLRGQGGSILNGRLPAEVFIWGAEGGVGAGFYQQSKNSVVPATQVPSKK